MSTGPSVIVMPASWRRRPVTEPEFEWVTVSNLPKTLWHFWVLVHHQRAESRIVTTVYGPAGEDFNSRVAAVVGDMPHVQAALLRSLKLDILLHTYYFPRLFAAHGFDRAAFGRALRSELPVALHTAAQLEMRHFLHAEGRVNSTRLARAVARKKPTQFRELAREVGRAVYKLGDVLDTWLWRQKW